MKSVVTLNKVEFENHCALLAAKVIEGGFSPNLIVDIARGGSYVVENMRFPSPVARISVRRQRAGTPQKAMAAKAIAMLPVSVNNFLRAAEDWALSMISNLRFTSDDRHRSIEVDRIREQLTVCNATEKSMFVLIVDDALDSGKTVELVREAVLKKYPSASVKVAVIVATRAETAHMAEFQSLTNVLVRFPWSSDVS